MNDLDQTACVSMSSQESEKQQSPRASKPIFDRGIGRFLFIVLFLGILFLLGIINPTVRTEKQFKEYNLTIVLLLLFLCLLVITALRLLNIRRSLWWLILLPVPILNLLVLLPCLYAPTGYADTKNLDLIGRIIIYTILFIFLLYAISAIAK